MLVIPNKTLLIFSKVLAIMWFKGAKGDKEDKEIKGLKEIIIIIKFFLIRMIFVSLPITTIRVVSSLSQQWEILSSANTKRK